MTPPTLGWSKSKAFLAGQTRGGAAWSGLQLCLSLHECPELDPEAAWCSSSWAVKMLVHLPQGVVRTEVTLVK